MDTTRTEICQARVGFSAAGPTLNGICGKQRSHQHNVSSVRFLENLDDGSSRGGGRGDREENEQDEGSPEVIPVARKLHHLPTTAEQELHSRTHVIRWSGDTVWD